MPNLTEPYVPWSPPNGQSVPYDAYVYSSIPGPWVGSGPGNTNPGVTVPNGTAYWIGVNTITTAPVGIYLGGEAGQRDTAFRTTFVNTGAAGNYALKFTATGDNFISIFANGTLANVGANPNRFTVSGGNQIGTTAGDYTRMLNYESVVPLLSGTNQLYVIIGDQGGATGMIFGGFTEVVPESVPEIDAAGMGSVLALVAGALGLLERRRKRA